MKTRYVLLSLLILLLLPLGAAAQTTAGDLAIVVDAPVVAAGEPVSVTLKNFNWSQTARLTVTGAGGAEPVTVAEGLRLGPRRRATLPANLPAPGLWHFEMSGLWVFGSPIIVSPATALVATDGSTTGAIALDQTVEGELVPDPAWEGGQALGGWHFDLAESQSITIRAQPREAGRVRLSLLGSGAEVFAEGEALIANRELPPGRYLIALTADEATGYSLTLSDGLSGDSEGGALEIGALVPGLIAPPDDVDEFTFDGAPGDVVYAAMSAADASLDPYLELLDPAGNVVARNDDRDGFDAALAYVVPLEGRYTLRLSSNAGGSAGSYTLEVAHDPEMARLAPPTATEIGATGQGAVERSGAEAWRFAGRAGQAVGLQVVARDAGFDARLALYGPDGRRLAENDDAQPGNLNPLINFTLPDDGFYTAVIDSYDGSPGAYDLTLSAEPIAVPTP